MWDFIKHISLKEFAKTYYFSLSVLLFICIAICYGCEVNYLNQSICNAWARDLFLNLIAEIIGILLVLFFVNRSVTINQQQEKSRFRQIAFRQLKMVLTRHVYLLFYMLKASVEVKPNKTYENLSDLFDDTYFNELGNLDLFKVAPVLTPRGNTMNWLDYIYSEFSSLKSAISKVMDRYSFSLDSEEVDLLEEFNDTAFIYFISVLREAKELNNFEVRGDLLSECEHLLREYTTFFLRIVDLYNHSLPSKSQIKIDSSKWNELWSNNVKPQIGESRIEFLSQPYV